MKKWQCHACNYTHTGDEPPESCPVCGVSLDLFTAIEIGGEAEKTVAPGEKQKNSAQCTVCGYVHRGSVIPENCPVCGVGRESFSKITGPANDPPADETKEDATPKKWRCEICGYVHIGSSPPAKCPVCGADRSMFVLLPEDKTDDAQRAVFSAPEKSAERKSDTGKTEKKVPGLIHETPQTIPAGEPSRFSHLYIRVTTTIAKLHAHPISVHIPNGVLPVAFIFLLLGVVFENDGLLQAAHFNLIFVLISMPAILFSGYNDWKIRLKGHMTQTIRVKIICGVTVTILSFILVVWRFAQPHVLAPWASGRYIYMVVFGLVLVAAAVAGFFGGKLIQFPGDKFLSD
jgi:rubrerythrin/uncharacterized membrane protein